MPSKDTTPLSLYGNDREYLREQERTNELLADIAGETYESPGNIPNGKYILQKRMLDAAQKKNELLESIAEGGGTGGGGAAKGIDIDYGTDVISLKNKDGDVIAGSGATLPAYGVSFDPTTGGLTLTKNGTALSGQTVTIPNYGSPVGVTSSSAMTDEGTIYLYEGTTGGGFTNGHFYYYDGSAWADGGEYAAATVQTDKTLLVENRAADAKATGEAIDELKESLTTEKSTRQSVDTTLQNNINTEKTRAQGEEARIEALFVTPTQEAIDNWFAEHPDEWVAVQDGSISETKLTSDLINKIEFTKTIEDAGGFENAVKSATLGAYTGKSCTIDSAIDLSNVEVANHIKVFANIAFTLNDDMFTWDDTSYKTIPSFVNCVFYGHGNNIVADGKYPVGVRFINCVFYQCGFINNCDYVQSIRFIGCRFIGSNDIISGIGCSDIVFDNCQCEADFQGAVVNMIATSGQYSIDKLSIKNSVIESNSTKEIIKFNRCATIDIDSCYFEANSRGIIKATEAISTADFIVLNISNTKMHSCGDPYLYIDASYRTKQLKLVISSCTFSTLTTGTARALLNRYEYGFSIIDCQFINVTSDESFSINYRLMNFARTDPNDSTSPITTTVQLSPHGVYYLMQSRGSYTGIIVYMIATHQNDFIVQKICDDNNRWTITNNGVQEDGRISITITTTGFGMGKVIYLGGNES